MGRVNINEVDNYKGNSGTNFFGLENDKDVATVRFCHNDAGDIEIIACHEIEVDGKRRKVSCLRSYDDPIHLCPLCAAGNRLQLRYFVHLIEYHKSFDGKITSEKKVWERGRTFQKEILGLSGRYNPLWQTAFEIERQGKKGDQTTKYGIYPMNYSLDEFPAAEEDLENDTVMGTIVLDKNADELSHYINTGEFPSTGATNGTEQVAPRRDVPTTPNYNVQSANQNMQSAAPSREIPSSMGGMSRRRI